MRIFVAECLVTDTHHLECGVYLTRKTPKRKANEAEEYGEAQAEAAP
jgi:hypothetical protein